MSKKLTELQSKLKSVEAQEVAAATALVDAGTRADNAVLNSSTNDMASVLAENADIINNARSSVYAIEVAKVAIQKAIKHEKSEILAQAKRESILSRKDAVTGVNATVDEINALLTKAGALVQSITDKDQLVALDVHQSGYRRAIGCVATQEILGPLGTVLSELFHFKNTPTAKVPYPITEVMSKVV